MRLKLAAHAPIPEHDIAPKPRYQNLATRVPMAGKLLTTIDQRTRLAGHNRLALLLFRLGGRQRFGVNVFKVQEVIKRPQIWEVPSRHAQLLGVADVRGRTVPVLDLGRAINHPDTSIDDTAYLVVTEFNRTVQGFLVTAVDRIVNLSVEEVTPPPDVGGETTCLTAVTRYQNEIIQIIDVEKVLSDVSGASLQVSQAVLARAGVMHARQRAIVVVDDSRVARGQIHGVLDQLGLEATLMPDGRQALRHLKEIADRGERPSDRYAAVISDIEMPDMDGYTLTTEIRRDARLADMFVILHTSLSGIFNNAMVARVGANRFVAKYSPDELAETVIARMRELEPKVA
jgi:two-component system chemotaxis response regulator CheV